MHDHSPPPRLAYTLAETGQLLGGVSVRSVYNLIGSGALQAIRIGGRRLVRREAIEALLAAASEAGK